MQVVSLEIKCVGDPFEAQNKLQPCLHYSIVPPLHKKWVLSPTTHHHAPNDFPRTVSDVACWYRYPSITHVRPRVGHHALNSRTNGPASEKESRPMSSSGFWSCCWRSPPKSAASLATKEEPAGGAVGGAWGPLLADFHNMSETVTWPNFASNSASISCLSAASATSLPLLDVLLVPPFFSGGDSTPLLALSSFSED